MTMTRRLLFAIIGALVVVLILVGVGVFVLLPKVTSANSPQATPSATATTKKTTITTIVKGYIPTIRDQMAQGLHLTSDQLMTDLRSGQTLDQIATTQKVSSTQLQTLISTSVTTGLQPAVDAGTLTQKQVDALVKRYEKSHTPLEKLLSAMPKTKKGATPTPTAGQ